MHAGVYIAMAKCSISERAYNETHLSSSHLRHDVNLLCLYIFKEIIGRS